VTKLKKFLSRIRLTYRRTNNVTKIAVAAAIVACMVTLTGLGISIQTLKNRTEDLRQKAAILEEANRELSEDISELGSDKSTVEIAEEELGLVQPGAVVIQTEPQESGN
jgi:cell division protein FtsB